MNDANMQAQPRQAQAQGTRGRADNFPPVGDIQIKKKSGTYNTYTWTLSYGQMEAIKIALEKDHSNPIADEMLAMLAYYIPNVPGPGAEEEDVKAREERAAIQTGEQDSEADGMLPAPPNEEIDDTITVAGEGPEGGFEDEASFDEEVPMDQGGGDEGPGALPGPEQDEQGEVDSRLEAPPRE